MDQVQFLCMLDSFLSCLHKGLEIGAPLSFLAQFLFPVPPPVPSSPSSQSAAEIWDKEWLDLHFLTSDQTDRITGLSQVFLAMLSSLSKLQTQKSISENNGRKEKLLVAAPGSCFSPWSTVCGFCSVIRPVFCPLL